MPGPPSATFVGTDEVGFCEEEDPDGDLISECTNPLYLKTPNTASTESYTVAKVIPGPFCKPNPDYTQPGVFDNDTDTVSACSLPCAQRGVTLPQVNQDDAEPCNCHNYNIRLAINRGNENPTKEQSRNVAKAFGIKNAMIETPGSPCSFRSASFAWDRLGDNEFDDSTTMAMQGNPQGKVRDMEFDPDGVQFRSADSDDDAVACNPETAPTCGTATKVSAGVLRANAEANHLADLNQRTHQLLFRRRGARARQRIKRDCDPGAGPGALEPLRQHTAGQLG